MNMTDYRYGGSVQVVCPSLGTRCGISEYTKSLCDAAGTIPQATFTSSSPTTILHIQHEYNLFDDEVLLREILVQKRRGVKIFVTEHTASQSPHKWDSLVDVWITHTETGYEWLTARNPRSYVTRIHHGCPTWFPQSTRDGVGKTIGTFGFLGRSKGYKHLMDVLDAIPGTELLIYGTARSSGQLDDFRNLCGDRAVHHVNDFRTERQVVEELAEKADALVFWYDEKPLATSGAVRVGLSTGKPVITSPTAWFADLRSCTYQPSSLTYGVSRILNDMELRESLVMRARYYCMEHDWKETARLHQMLWAEASDG